MRGFPLLNLILCALVSAAVLFPMVHRATVAVPRAAAAVSEAPVPAAGAGLRARVVLNFVHAPRSIAIKNGAAVLHSWKPETAVSRVEETMSLPVAEGHTEITVQIQWPAGTPRTVAEMIVEPDGLPARTVNVWSGEGGEADEVVSFTWKGGAS
jgi:hypothetical protein